ncbi:MAG: CapA family protein [Candidatus Paceibacterota bacterium]|jgi:poly-gamma-glutamate synthesis protein (capsule biosynthesis protein)
MRTSIKFKIDLVGLFFLAYFLAANSQHDINRSLEALGLKENEDEIRMVAVGDVMLSRSVEKTMIEKKNFKYPFIKTAELTSGADITFGNLETPIISGRAVNPSEMVFRADPRSVVGLKYAGFDVLSLANNHIMNFGKRGLEETLKELDKAGIRHAGAGIGEDNIDQGAVVMAKGVKFSFLAFTYNTDIRKDPKGEEYGVSNMDKEKMQSAVKKAKEEADAVIVSMHAGTEYKTKSGAFQQDFAHSAIDAGADLVIGHHPHVVQEVEKYNGKYIIYSLGNFVFDQMWSNETRLGAIAEITFDGKEIKSVRFEAVKIYDYSQASLIEGEEAKGILKRMKF